MNRQCQSERTPVRAVYGFPVAANQYSVLQSVELQSPSPREEGLVDPRTTRHLRQATVRAGNREETETGERSLAVHVENPAQANFDRDTCVEPVAVGNPSQFISYSLSASSPDILLQSGEPVHYMLGSGTGAVNIDGDAMYDEHVKDVVCMDFQNCNKRISCAGPEWSAGRPGHTPIRRDLACGNIIEDSCAGPDWSAGRPDLTSFGARTAPCLSSQTACLGPYGAAYRQPHHTGPNPREETSPASSSQRDHSTEHQPADYGKSLSKETPLKIARRQRRWHCNLAGHHIFMED